MNKCQRCRKEVLVRVEVKCSDCCFVIYPDGSEECGYAPADIGIGDGGDYVTFSYCASCGQIQGDFPIESILEKGVE